MMSDFKVILMYSEAHNTDMWWVERIEEVEGEKDYYGPFFEKAMAQSFLDHEFNGNKSIIDKQDAQIKLLREEITKYQQCVGSVCLYLSISDPVSAKAVVDQFNHDMDMKDLSAKGSL